jgi:uncharacterized membrane protein HdeD (DUF308 family)
VSYPSAPPPANEPAPVKQGNGFAIASLVLGLVGLIIFSWIPGISFFTAIPLGVLAVIFGIVAVVKAKSRGGKGKAMGITGAILGVLAIAASIIISVALVEFAKDQCADPDSEIYGTSDCDDIENM